MLSVKESIEQRRAARSFRPEPIPDEIFTNIINLGLRSPSGYNLQPWRFVVVRDAKNREKLKACAFNQRQVSEAPIVLICCGDRRVNSPEYIESIIELGQTEGAIPDAYADYIRSAIPKLFENHPCFEAIEAWINRQVMLAVAHLMIAAQGLGVDSSPMEGFVTQQVKEAFGIPNEVDICCLLALGYAAEPFKKYSGRFGIDLLCYSETYGETFY
jgi:nitroreductase